MVLVYLSMIEGPEDRNKFEIIYEQYKNLMYYVAYRILREERDAEDAVHNAFVRIAEHIEKISEPVCPKTRAFVVLIVERTAINEYNRQHRRRGLPLEEEALGASGAWAPEGPEEGDAVARAIAALPDRERELILLKHWQGFSDREIAGLMGMKPGAVSRALQRAKEKLRERLREEGIEVRRTHWTSCWTGTPRMRGLCGWRRRRRTSCQSIPSPQNSGGGWSG